MIDGIGLKSTRVLVEYIVQITWIWKVFFILQLFVRAGIMRGQADLRIVSSRPLLTTTEEISRYCFHLLHRRESRG